jgi:hypothetical protein
MLEALNPRYFHSTPSPAHHLSIPPRSFILSSRENKEKRAIFTHLIMPQPKRHAPARLHAEKENLEKHIKQKSRKEKEEEKSERVSSSLFVIVQLSESHHLFP